jgi:hypothetical protein
MKKAVLIIGIVLTVLSFCVFSVSLSLPIINAPRARWDEAMWGIIPGGLCCSLSFVIAVVGLVLVIMDKPQASKKKSKKDEDENADDGDE